MRLSPSFLDSLRARGLVLTYMGQPVTPDTEIAEADADGIERALWDAVFRRTAERFSAEG